MIDCFLYLSTAISAYLGDVNMNNDELNTESDTDSDTAEVSSNYSYHQNVNIICLWTKNACNTVIKKPDHMLDCKPHYLVLLWLRKTELYELMLAVVKVGLKRGLVASKTKT